MNNTTLYQKLIDDISSKISNGLFVPGDRIESLNSLCSTYSVSKITAIRALDELQDRGQVKKIHGRGTFVAGTPTITPQIFQSEIKSIILLIIPEALLKNRLSPYTKTYGSVIKSCEKAGLKISYKYPEKFMAPEGINPPNLEMQANEALIAYYGDYHGSLAMQLYGGAKPGVVIDGFIPGAHCVLADNAFGIELLIKFLFEKKCKKLLFAPHFSSKACSFNINERTDAFIKETTSNNIKYELFPANNYNEIIKLMNSRKKPDAILFPHDDPALNCINILEERGFKIPNDVIICGFDGFSSTAKDLSRLVTVKINWEDMGKAAVNIITSGELKTPMPLWRRIKPQLQIGKNSGF